METIRQKILKHHDLYVNAGLEVPPYRITGVEHRMLKDELEDTDKQSIFISVNGIQLEHVIKLTDY